MAEPFWKDGLQFSCTQCSACCRFEHGFVYLSVHDLQRLVQWSTLKKDIFIKKYCYWVEKSDGFEYLCLKEQSNFDCILWDNGCVAYEYRPAQCSSYPFWGALLSNKAWWNSNAKSCPGCNHGAYHSQEEIQEYLLAERQVVPIKRRKK